MINRWLPGLIGFDRRAVASTSSALSEPSRLPTLPRATMGYLPETAGVVPSMLWSGFRLHDTATEGPGPGPPHLWMRGHIRLIRCDEKAP